MFGPMQAPQATALVFGGMAAEVQGKAVSLSRSPSRPKPAARHQPSTVPPCPSAAASQPDHVDVRTPHSTPWWVSRAAHPPPRAPLLVKRALKVAAVSPPHPLRRAGPDSRSRRHTRWPDQPGRRRSTVSGAAGAGSSPSAVAHNPRRLGQFNAQGAALQHNPR